MTLAGPSRQGAQERCTRGSAIVEFVLVVPLVLLIFAAVCQIAFASYVRSTLVACAAEGARSGAQADADRTVAVRQTKTAIANSVAADAVDNVVATTQRADGAPVMGVTITARLPLFGLLGPATMEVSGHALLEGEERA